MKAAAVSAVAAVAGGVGYEGVTHAPWRSHVRPHVVPTKAKPTASVVKQSIQSPIQHASRLPGPGPSQPRGALRSRANPRT